MTYQHCLDRVAARGGLTAEAAERAVVSTAVALGGFVAGSSLLHGLLPDWLITRLRRGARFRRDVQADPAAMGPAELARFFALVQRGEGVPLAQAVEHAEVVLAVLAEDLGAEAIEALSRRTSPAIAELLRPRHLEGEAPPGRGGRRGTLASGRPGSRHPVSEAHPGRAQDHSIASAADPHADRKLSAGHGSEDEPERTIAGGQPGSDRPLSDGSE